MIRKDFEMKCGLSLTFRHKSFFSELVIISVSENQLINGYMYSLYHLPNEHELYVKSNLEISDSITIKGHLIVHENEIHGDDYYIKTNQKLVLPV